MHAHNPNPPHLDFGTRLTQAQYEQQTIALYTGKAPMPSVEEERVRRRAELELLVDYHLGQDFPKARREALWQAQDKMDKRRGWNLLVALLSSPWDPLAGVFKSQVRGFAAVLNAEELRALLDLSEEDLNKFLGRRLAKTPR